MSGRRLEAQSNEVRSLDLPLVAGVVSPFPTYYLFNDSTHAGNVTRGEM